MRPFRGALWLGTLITMAGSAVPAKAAWDNVFQVTCWWRHRAQPAQVSYYSAPSACCAPAPCQSCVSYVQRCYYQPVTHYESRSYYESVTSYRTSYYYEPVTSYTYTSYYDPCTCTCKQVACPRTCYQLRAQTCPVQNWVQRCYSVPITTYQQSFYWEAVNPCGGSVAAAPAAAPGCCGTAAAPAIGTGAPQAAVTEQPRIPAPGVTEGTPRSSTDGGYNRNYPPQSQETMPKASGSSYQQPPAQQTPPPPQASPGPSTRLDRIVLAPVAEVHGNVVRGEDRPLAGARILFVSSDQNLPRQTVQADSAGSFHVPLSTGGWLIYVDDPDGRPVFQRKIHVQERQAYLVSLAMR